MDDKRMAVALQLRRAIELLVQSAPLSDDEALSVTELYEPWASGKNYETGRIVKYGDEANLYSVIQAHVGQEDWTPDTAASLYRRIGFTDAGIPIWVQPLGASDAYALGSKVSHAGSIWISDIGANVWEPGIYGWRPDG